MSVNRAVLFVLAALSTVAMTSAASAGCGGCGTRVYVRPVIAVPPPRPVFVHTWTRTWTHTCGCACSCRGLFAYAPTPIAPAPIYVVDQGPDYTGPGIMVPYHTWTHPYLPGYRYGYGRFRYRHYGYGFGVHRVFRTRFHRHAFFHRTTFVGKPGMHGKH